MENLGLRGWQGLNKRDRAILSWVEENRPDILAQVIGVFELSGNSGQAFNLIMSVSFEAGRQFQVDNSVIPLNSPGYYLD